MNVDQLRADEVGLPLGESHPDEPLVCFPMRIEWEMTKTKVAKPYPGPRFTTADGHAEPARPGPVSELERLALDLGWRVRVMHSAGHPPHSTTGAPLAYREVWSVRMARLGDYAVAVREGDKWQTMWVVVNSEMTRYTTLGPFQEAIR